MPRPDTGFRTTGTAPRCERCSAQIRGNHKNSRSGCTSVRPGPRAVVARGPSADNPRVTPPTEPDPTDAISPLEALLELPRSAGEDTLDDFLVTVADTVCRSAGFASVVINLYRPAWDDYEAALVIGGRRRGTARRHDAELVLPPDLRGWQSAAARRVLPHRGVGLLGGPAAGLRPGARAERRSGRLAGRRRSAGVPLGPHRRAAGDVLDRRAALRAASNGGRTAPHQRDLRPRGERAHGRPADRDRHRARTSAVVAAPDLPGALGRADRGGPARPGGADDRPRARIRALRGVHGRWLRARAPGGRGLGGSQHAPGPPQHLPGTTR